MRLHPKAPGFVHLHFVHGSSVSTSAPEMMSYTVYILSVCYVYLLCQLDNAKKRNIVSAKKNKLRTFFWCFAKMSHAIRKTCLMPHTNNKGADQPAHPRSLISTFIVRCLDSMIRLLAIANISSL